MKLPKLLMTSKKAFGLPFVADSSSLRCSSSFICLSLAFLSYSSFSCFYCFFDFTLSPKAGASPSDGKLSSGCMKPLGPKDLEFMLKLEAFKLKGEADVYCWAG